MSILDLILSGKFDFNDQSALDELVSKSDDFKQLVKEIVKVHVKARYEEI